MILIRNIFAVIVGLAIGMAVNMALFMLNALVLFPMPEGMDMNDSVQLNAWIVTLPTAAFFVVLAAHLGQSFVGGWVAARLGSSAPMLLAMMVGLASAIAFSAFEVVKPFTAKFALNLGLLPTAPKGFLEQLQYAYDPGFRASPSALVSLY